MHVLTRTLRSSSDSESPCVRSSCLHRTLSCPNSVSYYLIAPPLGQARTSASASAKDMAGDEENKKSGTAEKSMATVSPDRNGFVASIIELYIGIITACADIYIAVLNKHAIFYTPTYLARITRPMRMVTILIYSSAVNVLKQITLTSITT